MWAGPLPAGGVAGRKQYRRYSDVLLMSLSGESGGAL
jgi:hypothetical protein